MYHPNIENKPIKCGSSIKELQLHDSESSDLLQSEKNNFKISKFSSKPFMIGGGSTIWTDSVILFIVFVIMSQDVTRSFISKYLYDVNNTTMMSTIIYGIILVSIYLISRKLYLQFYGN